jgi:hypothetical protein
VSDDGAEVLPFRRVLSETGDAGLIATWFDRAQHMRSAVELADFVSDLAERPDHSMESIVHAAAAVAVAASAVVLRSPSAEKLGAYHSVMAHNLMAWRYIEEFGGFDDGPKRMLQYQQLLYPRFADKFGKKIDRATMDWLIAKAKEILESGRTLHSSVRFHLEGISCGIPPFGFEIEEPDAGA